MRDGFLAARASRKQVRHADRRRADGDGEHHRQGQRRHRTGWTTRRPTTTRKSTLTALEQSCEQASKHDAHGRPASASRSTLYQGGQYFLYKYKRYTDVRLVFAPERGIAAFGGDPDNFQFPRWCLDMSVLRAYENGKPAPRRISCSFNLDGPKAGELVFVSGHPGSTDRLLTVAELEVLRNCQFRIWLLRASELRGRFIQFGKTSPENAAHRRRPAQRLENSIKVRRKQLDALLDDALMAAQGRRSRRSCAPRSRPTRAQGRARRPVGGHRAGRRRVEAAVSALPLSGARRRLQQRAVRLRAHAGARRRRARQAQRRAAARIHRCGAAAPGAAAGCAGAGLSGAREARRCPSAWSACANGWGRTIRWCASCWPRNRPTRWRSSWSTAPSSATRRCASAVGRRRRRRSMRRRIR